MAGSQTLVERRRVTEVSSTGAEAVPKRPKVRTLLPALTTAALLWACYFPLNAGWLAWVALVPLLSLVRSPARPRAVYFSAWLSGFAFFLVVLQWVRVADYRMYATWIGLAIWCSLFTVAGIYLVRLLDRRTALPLTLTVPVTWTALEFARAYLLTGFPWYFLSHSQHDYLHFIQISDLGGAYTVTFLLAAVNGWLFEYLCNRTWFRRILAIPSGQKQSSARSLLWQSIAILLLVGGTLGYGTWRLGQNRFATGPVVALLQGNLDQRLRIMARAPGGPEEAIAKFRKHYGELCRDAARSRPDLIVWPETSFLHYWGEVAPELPSEKIPKDWKDSELERRTVARLVADTWPTNVLLGLNTYELGADARERRYNSAVLIHSDANIAGRYDKMHCVPFGEYVPLRDWLPFMDKFAPYDFDYSITPGKKFTRFPLGKYHFGVVICYEDTDPSLAREYLRSETGEPAADFLINISNDGWFDGTSEHEQHLAICRFRAVECRRAVARAVNMGISAVIDGNGRIVALPGPDWQSSKKVEKVVETPLPLDRRSSLYAQWGDWLAWACWGAVGAAILWSILWPRRRSQDMLLSGSA